MQRMNSVMLSALMVAGLCLHALGQEAEIEVIELEPGVQLKKKIHKKVHRLKKGSTKHPQTLTLKSDDGKARYEVILGDNGKGTKVIDLGDGNKAIIRVETNTEGGNRMFRLDPNDSDQEIDVFITDDDDDDAPHHGGNAFMLMEDSDDDGDHALHELRLMDLAEGPLGQWQGLAGEAMQHLGNKDWMGIAKQLMKHLDGKVRIKIDGNDCDLHDLMGEHGIEFGKLHGADDIELHFGDRDFHLPMKMGRNIFTMMQNHGKSKAKSNCCGCCGCCGAKKSPKKHATGMFGVAPKRGGFFGGKNNPHIRLRGAKNFPKKHGIPSGTPFTGTWSTKAPKAPKKPTLMWDTRGTKAPKAHKKKSKKHQGSFYFSDGPKKKAAKRFAVTTEPKKGKRAFGGHILGLDGHAPKAEATRRWLLKHESDEHDDDGDEDHDDDELEHQIKSLERQVKKLRKELRALKRRI